MTLATQMTTDLAAVFFNMDDFAVFATFTHGGTPTTISVIFDDGYSGASPSGVEVETTSPQALAISTDVTGAVNGDTLAINGTTYYITSVQKDPPEGGPGTTLLILSKDWYG
jgi:hypothetical protein